MKKCEYWGFAKNGLISVYIYFNPDSNWDKTHINTVDNHFLNFFDQILNIK